VGREAKYSKVGFKPKLPDSAPKMNGWSRLLLTEGQQSDHKGGRNPFSISCSQHAKSYTGQKPN
jgi:hypothetical protein